MQLSSNGLAGEATLSAAVVRTPSARALAAGVAVAAAVALPQAAHVLGAALGLGPAVGQVLLPMFLPVMAVGLLAGPASGLVAGALAPLVSFALTGMPAGPLSLLAMVPEVATFGLACGLLATKRLPWIAKVLVSEAAGIVVYAVVLALLAALTGSAGVDVFGTVLSVARTGLPGLVIQWVSLPLMMRVVTRAELHHGRD